MDNSKAIAAAVKLAKINHRDWFACAILRRDPESPQAVCAKATRNNAMATARILKDR